MSFGAVETWVHVEEWFIDRMIQEQNKRAPTRIVATLTEQCYCNYTCCI